MKDFFFSWLVPMKCLKQQFSLHIVTMNNCFLLQFSVTVIQWLRISSNFNQAYRSSNKQSAAFLLFCSMPTSYKKIELVIWTKQWNCRCPCQVHSFNIWQLISGDQLKKNSFIILAKIDYLPKSFQCDGATWKSIAPLKNGSHLKFSADVRRDDGQI